MRRVPTRDTMAGAANRVPSVLTAGHERANGLGDAPGLRDAAPRIERRLRVEDLADGPEAGLGELLLETLEEPVGAGAIVGKGLEPSVDERADQPAPHRPLVICGVACAQISVIAGLVVGEPGCK